MLGVPIRRGLLKSSEEELGLLLREKVHAVVVVAVAGELARGLEVLDEPGLGIADGLTFAYLIAESESARTERPATPKAM